MNPYFAPSTEELLAHSSFLEELSCSLVSDRQTADDIVQDTWLAVLQHPPAHSINPAGWLRTVASNLARRDRRGRNRQTYREREVARPESTPGLDAEDDRTEALGRVAAAVEKLAEPYRTVVFLRFFENQRPSEISAQQGVPLATVKSQIHRGLGQLRDDLESDFGRDGADWRGALCACFGWRLSDGKPVPESVALTSASLAPLLLGVGLVALLTGFLIYNSSTEVSTSTTALAAPSKTEAPLDEVVETAKAERTQIAPQANPVETELEASKLAVLVTDSSGLPVQEATIWFATEGEFAKRGQTDVNGNFSTTVAVSQLVVPRGFSEMQAPVPQVPPRLGLMATAKGYCASAVSWVESSHLIGERMVVTLPTRGFRLTGRVVDEAGLPIPGAIVERHDSHDAVLSNAISNIVVQPRPFAITNSFGEFTFENLEAGLSWLRVTADSFAIQWERRVFYEDTNEEVLLTLEDGCSLSGRVVDLEGRPVAGARVWMWTRDKVHESFTLTSETGEYRLTGIPDGDRAIAILGGPNASLGARKEFSFTKGEEINWYPQLKPLRSVQIQLVDEEGVPQTDVTVHLRIRGTERTSRADLVTDDNGFIEFYEQSPHILRIDIYLTRGLGTVVRFPEAHLKAVRPGGGPHVVMIGKESVDAGEIRFDLMKHDGSPFPEVAILARASRDGIRRRIAETHDETSIVASDVLPGELELFANCTNYGLIELGLVNLPPGGLIELPEQRAPKCGVLRIDWRYPETGERQAILLQHFSKPTTNPLSLRIRRTKELTPLERYELLPGDYTLRVLDGRIVVQDIPFTIDSGFETLIEADPSGETED